MRERKLIQQNSTIIEMNDYIFLISFESDEYYQ